MKNSNPKASFGLMLLTCLLSLSFASAQSASATGGASVSATDSATDSASDSASGSAAGGELNSLFVDSNVKPKETAEPWTTDLESDFAVLEPVLDPARSPASNKKKAAKKQSKASRRSRLPAAVTDGFELRIKYQNLVTTFWVVKRGIRHDLMYSNSGGSKSALGLSLEQFKVLHSAALGLKPTDSNLTKCPNSSMQMYVVRTGSPERTIGGCVTDKSKTAEGLRNVSNLLAAMVR